MSRWLTHPWTVRACQLFVGGLLVWAALSKLGDLRSLAVHIHNFRLVPIAAENLLAMALPWIELVAALALILGVQARAGAVVAAGLLGVFALAVIAALIRGLDIECGCFGTSDASRVGLQKVLENLGAMALAVVASLNGVKS